MDENSTPKIAPHNANQGQIVAVIILFSVVGLIIGALYLAQAATDITNKNDIRQLEEERRRIERQNELLRVQIAELQNIDVMHERAATLGFRPAVPNDVVWIVVDGYVYNQQAPTPTLFVPTPTEAFYEENFAGWLKRHFDDLKKDFEAWSQ